MKLTLVAAGVFLCYLMSLTAEQLYRYCLLMMKLPPSHQVTREYIIISDSILIHLLHVHLFTNLLLKKYSVNEIKQKSNTTFALGSSNSEVWLFKPF